MTELESKINSNPQTHLRFASLLSYSASEKSLLSLSPFFLSTVFSSRNLLTSGLVTEARPLRPGVLAHRDFIIQLLILQARLASDLNIVAAK